MDVLRGVRTLYISTMYIVDNQTVKNMYKPKSLENDKKLFLMTDLGLYVGSDTNLDTSDINLDTNSDTKRINNVIRGHSQTSKQL